MIATDVSTDLAAKSPVPQVASEAAIRQKIVVLTSPLLQYKS